MKNNHNLIHFQNSNFVKSFHQPLMVKSKVQKPTVQQTNAAILTEKTPAELSKINKLSDFPLPSIGFAKKSEGGADCNGKAESEDDGEKDTFGLRALREQKLITSVTESEIDDETVLKNMEITKNMTPAQLSEIKSIKDFPIPEAFLHILDRPAKQMANGHGEANGQRDGEEDEPFYAGFLETKIVTNIKENTDYDTLKKRQDIVNSKTPAELSTISGLGDLPIPARIEKIWKGGDHGEETETRSTSFLEGGLHVPDSFKMELAVDAVVEDEEVVKQHMELVKTKSVSELSKVTSISDIPIPDVFENILKKKGSDNDSTNMTSSLSISDITSGKIIPESLRETKLITNIKVETDMDKLQARQTLIKNQTPMELGSVKNLSDFPIPSRLQNLHFPNFSKSSTGLNGGVPAELGQPTPPPRNKSCNASSIYESLPSSLCNELIVRSRTITDEESKLRQELIKNKNPVELSQMSSLKEFPVPRTIEKLFDKPNDEGAVQDERSFTEKYSTLPSSLKTNLLVGAKVEDQEKVYERAETIKAKSVSELSEIKTMSDIPIPSTLTRLAKRDYAPVERKKMFKQQMKSQSTQSLQGSSNGGTLPRSLRSQQLLVKAKVEDPEVLQARRSIVESKSVAELSKVSSISDIPVPGFLSKFASRSLSRLHSLSMGQLDQKEDNQAKGIYATLPKSLNCELLGRIYFYISISSLFPHLLTHSLTD